MTLQHTNPQSHSSADVEAAFGAVLPTTLRAAVDACEHAGDRHKELFCWHAEQIISENRQLRTSTSLRELCMPFDRLLFFSGAGDGDLFACAIDADGEIRREDIFRWRHEADAREGVAGNWNAHLAARRIERPSSWITRWVQLWRRTHDAQVR